MFRSANKLSQQFKIDSIAVDYIDYIAVLTLTALNYFCINHGKAFFQFEIIINVLVSFF